MTEWIVKHRLYSPCGRPALCIDHFDDEDCLSEFCHEGDPEDIVSVWRVDRYPLSIKDVTDEYVPEAVPSAYDLEALRGDQIRAERAEGVR